MADETEQAYLAIPPAISQEDDSNDGYRVTGEETSDSEDYDPSSILPQDYSIPAAILSPNQTDSVNPIPVLPEDIPSHQDVLSSPQRNISPDSTEPEIIIKTSLSPSQTYEPKQPRLKGGFVIDDDDDDLEEEDMKDGDVYGSADGMEPSATMTAMEHQKPLDSTDSPQVSIHEGVQVSSKADNILNGASRPVSSTPTPRNGDMLSGENPIVSAQSPPAKAAQHEPYIASSVSAIPKARLAHDTLGLLEDRINEDPRGDIDAWLSLSDELRSRNKKDEARRVYDRFFKIFPLCAEQWASYAAWENENNHLLQLEQIFNKSLLRVPSVHLWQIYLNYVRRRNSMTTGDTNKSYKIISDSFTFVLDNVGMDKDSGPIWQEYVNFIKTGPGVIGANGWQDTQKMDALRAAYQKAIAVPSSALAPLWKEYDGFEMGLSKINGRKFLQERSPAYMTARSCYTQVQNITAGLNRTTLPQLPPAPGFDGEHDFFKQVQLWKKWIDWEREDSLILKDDDPKAYKTRVVFTFRQALMALYFWPEIWYDAAEFCFEAGMEKEGLEFLRNGIAANPESCLLAFKLADHIELTTSNDDGNDPGAKRRMEKVREPYDKCLDALYEHVSKAKSREGFAIAVIEENNRGILMDTMTNNEPVDEDEYDPAEKEARRAAVRAQIDSIKQETAKHTAILQKTISYAWIALIRAARRIQGKGMPGEKSGGFRVVFGDARKRGKITSDVYVENALIEYHCYKDPVGTKIFERGMKLFPKDETFALEYLKHLIAINDITNARAVFETTVGKLTANSATAARAKPIFAFLHEYESHFGELSQVAKLEKRMADLYPDDALGLRQFSQRYSARSFDPTSVRLVISPTQTKTQPQAYGSIETEQVYHHDSPIPRVTDTGATNSPKRPFPGDEYEDGQPRKYARGESPLKGAAGRRMNQQQQHQHQRSIGTNGNFQPTSLSHVQMAPPPPLPGQLAVLLSIIPKASTYEFRRFDATKMADMMRNVQLPNPAAVRPGPPPAQAGQAWGSYQPQSQSHPPQSGLMAGGQPNMAGMPPYAGNFRY